MVYKSDVKTMIVDLSKLIGVAVNIKPVLDKVDELERKANFVDKMISNYANEIYKELNELKAKADKWDEKETPYKPKEIFNSTMFLGNEKYSYGDCKCSFRVFEHQKYCLNCGQKLDLESEGE
jgi:hypothetical protein